MKCFINYIYLPHAETSHALLAKAVGTTRGNRGLGHLELPALATAELLDRTTNTTLLWREHMLLTLEDLGVNVVTTRLGTIEKTAISTAVELATATADSYVRARLW